MATAILAGDGFTGTRTGLGTADVAGGAWKNNTSMGVSGGKAIKTSGSGTARGFATLPFGGSRVLTDGVVTSGSTGLASAGGSFTSDDVGRPVYGTGIPAGAVIAAYVSPTGVTMSAPATASGSALTIVINDILIETTWVTNAATNLSDAGISVRALDSWATRGGQLYVSFRKTSGGNSVRGLHRANTSGSDTVLFTNASAAWADGTSYDIQVKFVGKTLDVLRRLTSVGGAYSSVVGGPQTISDAVLNTLGTDVGISFTNTDTGSGLESFSAIDEHYAAATPVATTTKCIVHRSLKNGDSVENVGGTVGEESAGARNACPLGVNGGEVDVRKPTDSTTDYRNMHDPTSSRCSPPGATDFTAPGTVAQFNAASVPTTASFIAASLAKGDTDIHLQAEMDVQGDFNAFIGWLNSTYSQAQRDRFIIMTSATAGATPRADRIRIAGWTGRIGCYGYDSTTETTYKAQLLAASVFLVYLPLGDSAYTSNRSRIASIRSDGFQVGASTVTPAVFNTAVITDGVDYALTDYPVEFLALYIPPENVGLVSPTGRASARVVGTPTITATGNAPVSPAGRARALVVGQPSVAATGTASVAPAGRAANRHVGSPSASATGTVTVSPSGRAPSRVVGTPSVSASGTPTVSPSGRAAARVVGVAMVTAVGNGTVAPAGRASQRVVGTPSVTDLAVPTVLPSGRASQRVVGQVAVSAVGSVPVFPIGRASQRIVGQPVVGSLGEPSGVNFFVWDGTAMIPVTLLGIWDGHVVVPATANLTG